MAAYDYERRTGVPVSISATGFDDGKNINIHLYDNNKDEEVGVYTIDQFSGKGTNEKGEKVDLPQTGNNSLKNMLTALGAVMSVILGAFMIKKSGASKRRKAD